MHNTLDAALHCRLASPLGPITLLAHDHALLGLWFEGQRHFPDLARLPSAAGVNAVLAQAAHELQAYFAGTLPRFTVALDLALCSAFSRKVCQQLCATPAGRTTSYGAIAQQLSQPRAARAVGAAVARNPIGILVPCHRVLGSGGALTGYAGGLERKAALLELEGLHYTRDLP